MTDRTDLPTPDDTTAPYWSATAEGRLLLRHCNSCSQAHFYPRPFCPRCWSDDVVWRPASGRAQLYTYSIVRSNGLAPFSSQLPYVAAVVELEEGPRMMTNVIDCSFEQLEIGMALEVAFRDAEDFAVPVFRPSPSPGEEQS